MNVYGTTEHSTPLVLQLHFNSIKVPSARWDSNCIFDFSKRICTV